jgi:hypothetical protein
MQELKVRGILIVHVPVAVVAVTRPIFFVAPSAAVALVFVINIVGGGEVFLGRFFSIYTPVAVRGASHR